MKHIKIVLTLAFLFIFSNLQAQVYYPMVFHIVDQKTGAPLKQAKVSIKELGYQSKTTGSDGKVFFPDVPVGEVHYIVIRDGYNGADGAFNITSETKSNTLQVKLATIPGPKETMVLISGEVSDSEGKEIKGAKVELRAGNVVRNVETDASGNFNIEFNIDHIKYNVPEFILEVTKNGCQSKKEKFIIPKNNYIYKEIKLNCSGNDKNSVDGAVVGNKTWKQQIGEWDFEFLDCKKTGTITSCSFILKSNYRDRTIAVSNYSAIFDDFGNEYHPKSMKISNTNNGYSSVVKKRLIANVITRGSLTFENISTRAKKITLFELYVEADDLPINKIQFRDIPIK